MVGETIIVALIDQITFFGPRVWKIWNLELENPWDALTNT